MPSLSWLLNLNFSGSPVEEVVVVPVAPAAVELGWPQLFNSDPDIPDRVKCRVCKFSGVHILTEPGQTIGEGGAFSKEITGSVYMVDADQPVSLIDKKVFIRANHANGCPFCHAERFLDGRRTSGHS